MLQHLEACLLKQQFTHFPHSTFFKKSSFGLAWPTACSILCVLCCTTITRRERKSVPPTVTISEILMGKEVMKTSYNQYKVDEESESIVHKCVPHTNTAPKSVGKTNACHLWWLPQSARYSIPCMPFALVKPYLLASCDQLIFASSFHSLVIVCLGQSQSRSH